MWRLHHRKDIDCRFFQGYCEEGHYGGRARPTGTRQGIYCCTPSGKFLASVNTTDPARMTKMLKSALAKWKETPKSDRYLDYDPATKADEIRRSENRFPADGLALRAYSRDVPKRSADPKWLEIAWNVDSLWFTKAEARSLLPAKFKVGQAHVWPAELAQRLIRTVLIDNVRGQTLSYASDHVLQNQVTATIVKIQGNQVILSLKGLSQASTTGAWPKDGTKPRGPDDSQFARGVQTTLFGEVTYNAKTESFERFQLAAKGTRWGRTQYNFRHGDEAEAPIAFAIRLEPEGSAADVAPAHMGAYGW